MDRLSARARRRRSALGQMGARLPIRWRLTLMSFGLLAVLLAGLGAIVSVSEEDTMLANQAVALRREVRPAGGVLRQAGFMLARPGDSHLFPPSTMVTPNVAGIAILVDRLVGANTGAALYAPDGMLLYSGIARLSTDAAFVPAQVTVDGVAIRQAARSAPAEDTYSVATDTNGERHLVVLLPIQDVAQQATVAVLEVDTPTAPIDAAVTTTRLVLALGIAAALGVAAALMFPLMSAGLRPLVAMEHASERIAAGALSLRLQEPPTHDEIGRLAHSFNMMVAQLEAAFARQKQFVADVSHELRTPLTALGGGLEMLMLGADRGDAEAARRLTRGMYREVERMRRLVEDLLTLTRLDEGRAHLRTDPVEVGPLLAEVAEQAERLARGQTVRVEIAPQLTRIRADADSLRQVLLNLVDNAIKYTPAEGMVTLGGSMADARHVELRVSDTGEGIPDEDLPYIFERFYRVDRARARRPQRGGGAGLGLAIAKGLVEAQGGTIELASVAGEGTTVTLHFPIAQETPSIGQPTAPAALPASSAVPQLAPPSAIVEDSVPHAERAPTDADAHPVHP